MNTRTILGRGYLDSLAILAIGRVVVCKEQGQLHQMQSGGGQRYLAQKKQKYLEHRCREGVAANIYQPKKRVTSKSWRKTRRHQMI